MDKTIIIFPPVNESGNSYFGIALNKTGVRMYGLIGNMFAFSN